MSTKSYEFDFVISKKEVQIPYETAVKPSLATNVLIISGVLRVHFLRHTFKRTLFY